MLIQTVLVINYEADFCVEPSITGASIRLGYASSPLANPICTDNINHSGAFSCGGKVGQYLSILKTFTATIPIFSLTPCTAALFQVKALTISQIRAYSYTANAYNNYVYSTSTINSCQQGNPLSLVVANTGTTAGLLKDSQCYNQNLLDSADSVKFYKIKFAVTRFVQKVTVIGDSASDYANFQSWFLTLGDAEDVT
jgi:hypothetical protein